MDFTGRSALVTGASRGIGRAIAVAFAAAGARVVVHYRADAAAAEATLTSLAGTGHRAMPADLRDPAAASRLVDDVVEVVGRLDVLVNNAGVFLSAPPLAVDFDDWQRHWHQTLETNLLGPAWLTYAAARHMVSAGGGRVVNVSSRGAFRGEPDAPAYAASKAGLNAFGQSMAQALGPHGVTVATVAPGFVETDMARAHLEGAGGDEIRAQSPLGRVATTAEVAAAVLFLASDEARFATGAILDVNGASYLRS